MNNYIFKKALNLATIVVEQKEKTKCISNHYLRCLKLR